MKPLGIHPSLRVPFMVVGAFCVLFAVARLSHWLGYKRADCTIGVAYVAYKDDHGRIKYDTNRIDMLGDKPRLLLPFVTMPELPATAKPGDHVTVFYHDDSNMKGDGVIYSFGTVWREPLIAVLLGGVLILLGLFFGRRQAFAIKSSNGNAI